MLREDFMHDIYAMIADERYLLADELELLDDVQWNTPSALPGWTICQVMAHLVWPLETSLPRVVWELFCNRFNLARMVDCAVAKEKRLGPELCSALRARANSRFHPPGLGPEAPLTDIVVHGLDIRWPIGLKRVFPVERTNIVLSTLLKPINARFFGTPRGFTFVAEDSGWTGGNGPQVCGEANTLMLALAGRKVALSALKGDGAEAFCSAFTEYS